MGSPLEVIAPLEYMINNINGLDLVAIVSQPARKMGRGKKLTDPAIAAYGKENGIKTLQPQKASDADFLDQLSALEPDLIITAAYGQILSEKFLAIPTRGTINIHPSLLPTYRGATPVQAALLNGDNKTGVSILFTVKKMDAGNIITQNIFDISPAETTGQLLKRMFEESGPMLAETYQLLMNTNFRGTPQNEIEVIHCKKIQKEDGFVNFQKPASTIYNQYRGLSPWPGTYGFLAGMRVSYEELVQAESNSLSTGEFRYDKKSKLIVVGTASNDIGISRLKPAGRKSIDATSFWNGLKDKENLRFDEREPTK